MAPSDQEGAILFRTRKSLIDNALRRIAAARRDRRHLYLNDWRFHLDAGPESAVETVLAWCRDTLSRCPRPFGIDHFDLAVAVNDSGAPPRSLSFIKIRPGMLYTPSFAKDLAVMLHQEEPADVRTGLYISAALFSWGAAAHAALPAVF
jgi:hypothetical protein